MTRAQIITLSFSPLLLGTTYLFFHEHPYLHPRYPWIIAFFCVHSVAVLLFVLPKKSDRKDFVLKVLGATVLRLLSSILLLGLVAYVGVEEWKLFLLNFAVFYALYVALEVGVLLA